MSNLDGGKTIDVSGSLDRNEFLAKIEAHKERFENGGAPTRFINLPLREAKLHHVSAAGVIFENCDFSLTEFDHGDFVGAIFRGCTLQQTSFISANLFNARFEDLVDPKKSCDLTRVILEHALASNAHFLHADLSSARASHAIFEYVNFTGSKLTDATFDYTNLWGSTGICLDHTKTLFAHFSAAASDPWSILRRTYTGPRFALNFLLFTLFVAILSAKAFALYGLALVEGAALIREPLANYCAVENACETTSLLAIVSGWDEGPIAFTYVLFSLFHNGLRFVITMIVTGMREEEDRSRVSPRLKPETAQGRKQCIICAIWSHVKTSYGWIAWIHKWYFYWARWVMVALFIAGLYNILDAKLLLPLFP